MNCRYRIYLASLLLVTQSPLLAEEEPSVEFLEFLGQWETNDGRWLGPDQVEELEFPDESANKVDRKPTTGEVE